MGKYNPNEYELVETRIKKFYEIYPDGRIITKWANTYHIQETPKTWVVKATVYLSAGDQANKLAKSTGYASETEGTGGPNSQGAAFENCETSAIGRALANMGMSGNKRASREEMEKVERVSQTDWIAEAQGILNVNDLRTLYTRAKANGASAEVLEQLKDYANALNTSSEDSGARGSVPGSGKGGKR